MKDREEFLASVYAKRDQELVRRKKYKKRVAAGLSTTAACLVLMVGLTEMDVLDFMGAAAEGAGADGAAMESMVEKESVDGTVMPGNAAPSGTPGLEPDTARKDIYDLAADEDSDDLAYYCLPCFSIEEFGEGSVSMTRGSSLEDVKKVQVWVEHLAASGQVLTEELESLDDVTCIVTIELEPQQKDVYYLTGEVGWYE